MWYWRRDSFICVIWLIHVWHVTLKTVVDLSYSFKLMLQRLLKSQKSPVTLEWVMSHWIESCHTWVNHVTHFTHVRLWRICRVVPFHWCDSHVTHGSVLLVRWVMSLKNESCHSWMSHVTHEWVTSHMNDSCHTWMSHVTQVNWVMSRLNASCHSWMSHVTHK